MERDAQSARTCVDGVAKRSECRLRIRPVWRGVVSKEEVGRNLKSSMRRIPVVVQSMYTPQISHAIVLFTVQPFFFLFLYQYYIFVIFDNIYFLRGPTGSRPGVILI